MAPVKQSSLASCYNVEETATLTWAIDEFEHVSETVSPNFAASNSNRQFILELNASNALFRLNRIVVELTYIGPEDALFCYRISILDANRKKHYTKEFLWKYEQPNYGWCLCNVQSYITRDQCLESLVNGNLIVHCEVDILALKLPARQIESIDLLSKNNETLLESGKWTDFTVAIGDKQLHVHKNILAARCAVFAAMFEHHETKEMKEGRVVIEDVAFEVFELLIRYIYTGKVEPLGELAAELYIAADKYQLDHLKCICEQSLISSLATESACDILLLSDMHNANQLKSECIEYIIYNWAQVKETATWKDEIRGKRADLIEQILDCSASN